MMVQVLQTVAPLWFRDDDGTLLDAEHLRAIGLLPDLTGRHVMFVGLGNAVAPQEKLDQRVHNRLIYIWRAIADEAGAACVDVVDTPPAVTEAVDGVREVSPVPEPPAPPRSCGETVLNDRNDVGFQPDKDSFVDAGAARRTVGQVAHIMRDGHQRAELIGTTANILPPPTARSSSA